MRIRKIYKRGPTKEPQLAFIFSTPKRKKKNRYIHKRVVYLYPQQADNRLPVHLVWEYGNAVSVFFSLSAVSEGNSIYIL